MKLTEFIQKLQEIEKDGNGELPVCLADWGEGYRWDSEEVAEGIEILLGNYCTGGAMANGTYLCIGG